MLERVFDDLTIRHIRPTDKGLLAASFASLSDESRRARFLAPKPRLSSTDLRYLTEVDGTDHVALVALSPRVKGRILAVARFVRTEPGADTAEFAIVVGDEFQGRGLGNLLADRLVLEALERGVRRFTATTLSDNVPAQRLIAHLAHRGLAHVGDADGVREMVDDLAA